MRTDARYAAKFAQVPPVIRVVLRRAAPDGGFFSYGPAAG